MLSPASWPLRVKLTLLLLGAAVVPLALITALWLRAASAQVEEGATALLRARADQLATELDAFHGQYSRMTRRMAALPTLVRYCAGDPGARADAAEVLARTAAGDARLRGLAIFDTGGTITLGTEDPLLGRSYGFRRYFKDAARGAEAISDLYLAVPEVESVPSIAYAVPVRRSGSDEVTGVLVAYVRATALWDEVRRGDGRAGEGSFAVVYDRHGVRVAHSRAAGEVFRPAGALDPATVEELVQERRFGERTRALLESPVEAPAEFARARAPAPPDDLLRVDPAQGAASVAVVRRLEAVPWTLFVLVPEASVQAPVRRLLESTSAALGLVIAAALAVGLLASRPATRRIATLARAAAELERGALATRVDVRGDDELAVLGGAFNRMAAALGEAQARLEERVAARTEALSRANAALEERNLALQAQTDALARRERREQGFARALLALSVDAELSVQVGDALRELAGPTGCVVLACARVADDALQPVGGWGLAGEVGGPVTGLVREALTRGEPVANLDLPEGAPLRFDAGLAGGPVRALTIMPLSLGGVRPGVLLAGALAPLEPEGLELLSAAANALALAIARHDLRRDLARRNDALTAQADELRAQQAELEAQQAELEAKNVELSAQARALQAATRHKSEFLANMSHELRTPLNAVIGFADLLLDPGAGLPPAQRRHAEEVLLAGRHLLGLINDALDLARVEAGRVRLEPEPVPAAAVVREAAALVEVAARTRSVTVGTVVPDDLVVRADRARLRQILVNLLSNAIKFSPDGGEVRVEVVVAGAQVRFAVQDQGPGVPPGLRPRLFEPFVQGEHPLTKRHDGTGLGLAISRMLARLHGGDLTLVDAPGAGARFELTLPAAPASDDAPRPAAGAAPRARPRVIVVDAAPGAPSRGDVARLWLEQAGYEVHVAPTAAAARDLTPRLRPAAIVVDAAEADAAVDALAGAPPVVVLKAHPPSDSEQDRAELLARIGEAVRRRAEGERLRVLVIDDDPRVGELLRAMLEPAGYTTIIAPTGGEGLALARQAGAELVIIDLLLPDISGFDVVEALAADEGARDRPMLVLTSADLDPAQREWLSARAQALAAKGDLTREALLGSLAHLLRAGPPVAGARVLVVDDHDANRALVQAILEQAGFGVLAAREGTAGVALARAERPAAILMDIAMPGMDGFAALRALRADAATRDIPVAALTALAMRKDEERMREAGFDAYLSKPLDRRRLVAEVTRLVTTRRGVT